MKYVTFKFYGGGGPEEVTVLRSAIIGLQRAPQIVATSLLLDSGAKQFINYLDFDLAKKTLDEFDTAQKAGDK